MGVLISLHLLVAPDRDWMHLHAAQSSLFG